MGHFGIALHFELTEAHLQRIIEQQPANQRRALAQNQLHGLGRLDAADQAREDAENATLRHSSGTSPGGGGSG